MILRSLTKHIKDQNWFAVWLDLAIVVLGVFIGIQVANWNEARSHHKDYLQALGRLETEITENLASLDESGTEIEAALAIGRGGLDALLTCAEGPAAIEAVNAGIEQIRGFRYVFLRTSTLTDLTSNPNLLVEQSDLQRKRFADLLSSIELAQSLPAVEKPLQDRNVENATISIKPAKILNYKYLGMDVEFKRYPLELAVGMQQACVDKQLLKWFHAWEVLQSNVAVMMNVVREEYKKTQALLQERR